MKPAEDKRQPGCPQDDDARAAGRSWYLVYAKPRMEQVAEENLARQGYHIYLPRIRATHRLRGRYRERIEPMFPRYLFIHLDECNDNWGPIRSTLGVSGMVRFGGLAARAPDALIETLRGNEDAEGLQQRPTSELAPGDRVRVIDGVLSGYEGVLSAKEGRERVAVLLELAGHCTTVHMSAHDLQSL